MFEITVMIKKVCVIGEAAVGITSLIRRYVLDRFDDGDIAILRNRFKKANFNFMYPTREELSREVDLLIEAAYPSLLRKSAWIEN